MADAPEQPIPADITALTDDLTSTQLRTRRQAAAVELADLIANGDRTLTVAGRVRDLRSFISGADEKIRAIEAVSFESIPEPEPPAPPAPVAAVDPEPDPEPAPEPEPEPEAEMTDTTVDTRIAELERQLSQLVAGRMDGEGGGVEVDTIQPDQILEPGQGVELGAPMFATTGTGTFLSSGDDTTGVQGGTNLAAVCERMRQLPRLMAVGAASGGAPYRVNLWRRAVEVPASVPKLGTDPEANTRLLLENPEAIAAAAQFAICGTPVEVPFHGCTLDSSTPFIDNLASNTVAATNCSVRFRQPLDIGAINPQPQIWTADNQDDVVAATPSTWKPITLGLPACTDYCTVEPFDTIWGLRVTLNDQICRPELIAEVNRWIEVYHAMLLEKTAMSIFDANVDEDHHYSFDTATLVDGSDFQRVGAAPALAYGVHALLQRVSVDRHLVPTGWTAFIHPSIASTVAMDMLLAGENPGDGRGPIEDLLRSAGITRVVWTKDFGSAEGALATGYDANDSICDIDSNDWPATFEALAVAFGGGTAVPDFLGDARIRIAQPENWYHGTTSLVDYALMTSPELMRQNAAEYFGERRDFLFPVSSCSRREFVLDVTGLCPTGGRVGQHASVACLPAPEGP